MTRLLSKGQKIVFLVMPLCVVCTILFCLGQTPTTAPVTLRWTDKTLVWPDNPSDVRAAAGITAIEATGAAASTGTVQLIAGVGTV